VVSLNALQFLTFQHVPSIESSISTPIKKGLESTKKQNSSNLSWCRWVSIVVDTFLGILTEKDGFKRILLLENKGEIGS
jgi:hypothetical protein